ncbi:MAG: acyl-CoA thioesterase [Puniceicoccales bacterium]|jgi:acyl-CoA thioester hydrolase|nr:acyl-CoA thioesterase [Puniceicoccales bacterium]
MDSSAPPDPPRSHDIIITVSEADIDQNRHANNIAYLRWIQEAATAHWEFATPPSVRAEYSWVVTRHEIDYKRPAFLGDLLRVRTWVATMSAVLSERRCLISRVADNAPLSASRTLWCAINPATGRPRRIAPSIPRLLLVSMDDDPPK